jgi:hypothetical protein
MTGRRNGQEWWLSGVRGPAVFKLRSRNFHWQEFTVGGNLGKRWHWAFAQPRAANFAIG